MIRGKYLRERKGIRFRRRLKLVMTIFVLLLVHRIVFNSFSLYESNAVSEASIDVAFFLLADTYEKQTINIGNMLPGDTKTLEFSISNYKLDEVTNEEEVTETDMEYDVVVRSTTNLPLQYEVYKSINGGTSEPIALTVVEDAWNTPFYTIIDEEGDFEFTTGQTDTYEIKVTLPEEYDDITYQNVIECIEISVTGHQKVK